MDWNLIKWKHKNITKLLDRQLNEDANVLIEKWSQTCPSIIKKIVIIIITRLSFGCCGKNCKVSTAFVEKGSTRTRLPLLSCFVIMQAEWKKKKEIKGRFLSVLQWNFALSAWTRCLPWFTTKCYGWPCKEILYSRTHND